MPHRFVELGGEHRPLQPPGLVSQHPRHFDKPYKSHLLFQIFFQINRSFLLFVNYHTACEKKMQYLIKILNQENNTYEKSGTCCLS